MQKITIGILTYNHEKFIEKCLHSVLALSYENLEIIISDDCSKDNTYKIVQEKIEKFQTSHQIVINKNEVNLGLAENFNKTFGQLATGEFLITLGGDDMIKQDYLELAISYFEKDPYLMMLDFTADTIDENEMIIKPAKDLRYKVKYFNVQNYLSLDIISSFAPGRMIRRNLISEFQPISKLCPTEDSVLVLRALMIGKMGRINKNVVFYRRHSNNVSSSFNLNKLSNSRIIAQYLRDAIYLYKDNKISEEMIGKLLDRINFEFHKRQLVYGRKNVFMDRLKFRLRKYLFLNTK